MTLLFSSQSLIALDYNLSGYLTFGVGRMAHDGATYLENDTSYNYDMESKIGLQLDVNFTEKLQLTTQVLARGNFVDPYDEYRPQIEWAFLSYRFAPAWQARIGRLRIPNYLISDYRDVGYAIPWVRAPIDMYNDNLAFLNNFDGVELQYSGKWKTFDYSAHLYGGGYDKDNDGTRIRASKTAGMSFVVGTETTTLRFSHSESRIDLVIEGSDVLITAFESLGPPFDYLVRRGLINDERYIYDSIGFNYDNDEWVVHSEVYRIETDHDSAPNYDASYISIGYQFDQFTPFVTTGRSFYAGGDPFARRVEETYAEDILPREGNDYANFLRDEAVKATASYLKQYTISIGVRWDPVDSVAVKFEALEFDPKDGTCGELSCQGKRSKDAILYSFTIDAVF